MNYAGPVSKPDIAVSHGVIRWDAWYGNTAATPAFYTARTYDTITPVNYQAKAPLHLNQGTSPVTWADSQSTFDNEITVAKNGGIDYFAYFRYDPVVSGGIYASMNTAYNYHLSSSIGNQVGAVMIRQANDLGTTGSFATQVANCVTIMQGSKYYLQNGRPLMYVWVDSADIAGYWSGSFANLATCIASIRSQAIAGGLANPWIVSMGAGAPTTTTASLGVDACCNYLGPIVAGLPSTYADFDANIRTYWDTFTNQMVPITMVGWDNRARVQQPEPWATGLTTTARTTTPTLAQFASHLMAARAYVRANPVRCPLKTVLTYAWDECDEGGQMPCPTVGDPSGTLSRSYAMSKQAIF